MPPKDLAAAPIQVPGLTYTVIVNWNGLRETVECLSHALVSAE